MKSFLSLPFRRIELRSIETAYLFSMSRSGRWRKYNPARKEARAASNLSKMEERTEETADYSAWSHDKLIERVTQLEEELKSKNLSITAPNAPAKSWKKTRTERAFDPSKYSTRLIALKLAYLGKRYNGFEHTTGHATPLPTIEEEIWKALNKARLIFPKEGTNPLDPREPNWEGCDYSKCGRTDKGVSAFGQVIGIRVRSSRPLAKKKAVAEQEEDETGTTRKYPGVEDALDNGFNTLPREHAIETSSPPLDPQENIPQMPESEHLSLDDPDFEEALNFDPIADELPYISLLNRLLPPDIKILAWCPSPPLDFSARFSCRERQYRYFFTQPCFVPLPHNLESPELKPNAQKMKDGWLNIDAMREAAKMFEGDHDFRNFCKIDGGKQISNFERRIFFADIEEVEDRTSRLGFVNGEDFIPSEFEDKKEYPKVYTFTLHGSAFLWHQVRCMVAILFLVGQGLEKPSIVKELFDVEKNPGRPAYEMASDTPLVLWDCIFPRENDPERKDAMEWIHTGSTPGQADSKFGNGGIMDELWKVWRERKVDEMLAGSLLGIIANQGKETKELSITRGKASRSQKVFDGGDVPRLQGVYIPVMKKRRMDAADVVNEKYALRKGFEGAEHMKMQLRGFRKVMGLGAEEEKKEGVEAVG